LAVGATGVAPFGVSREHTQSVRRPANNTKIHSSTKTKSELPITPDFHELFEEKLGERRNANHESPVIRIMTQDKNNLRLPREVGFEKRNDFFPHDNAFSFRFAFVKTDVGAPG
jgi:hypothetical protein